MFSAEFDKLNFHSGDNPLPHVTSISKLPSNGGVKVQKRVKGCNNASGGNLTPGLLIAENTLPRACQIDHQSEVSGRTPNSQPLGLD